MKALKTQQFYDITAISELQNKEENIMQEIERLQMFDVKKKVVASPLFGYVFSINAKMPVDVEIQSGGGLFEQQLDQLIDKKANQIIEQIKLASFFHFLLIEKIQL